MNHLLKLEGLSGRKLNREKTEIISIGKTLGKGDMPKALHTLIGYPSDNTLCSKP